MSAARIKSVLDLDPLDFTYTVVQDTIFGGLEVELGIINACLPVLRPLFGKAFTAKSTLSNSWSRKTEPSSQKPISTWSHTKAQSRSKKFKRLEDDSFIMSELTSTCDAEFDMEGQPGQAQNVIPGEVTVTRNVHVYTSPT
jgi:hypothetical protein